MHPSARMRTPWFCLMVGPFDGRAEAGACGCPEGSCAGLGEGGQLCAWSRPRGGASKSCVHLSVALHCAQGTRCTLPSGSRSIMGRSLGSAASRVRSSCTPVTPSCRVSQIPLGWLGGPTRVCERSGVLMLLGRLPEGHWGHRPSGKWELGCSPETREPRRWACPGAGDSRGEDVGAEWA